MRKVVIKRAETRYVFTRKEIEGAVRLTNPQLDSMPIRFEWQPVSEFSADPNDEILVAYFETTERTSD